MEKLSRFSLKAKGIFIIILSEAFAFKDGKLKNVYTISSELVQAKADQWIHIITQTGLMEGLMTSRQRS